MNKEIITKGLALLKYTYPHTFKDYTKEELVEILRKHPEKFNEWKVDQEEIDLSEVDFSGINFSEVDFS